MFLPCLWSLFQASHHTYIGHLKQWLKSRYDVLHLYVAGPPQIYNVFAYGNVAKKIAFILHLSSKDRTT